MGRDRIDWENLAPFPRKKRDGVTREQAADRLFHARKAKHKGRNHIHNWKRRQIKDATVKAAKWGQEKAAKRAASFIQRVREYWLGENDEHP